MFYSIDVLMAVFLLSVSYFSFLDIIFILSLHMFYPFNYLGYIQFIFFSIRRLSFYLSIYLYYGNYCPPSFTLVYLCPIHDIKFLVFLIEHTILQVTWLGMTLVTEEQVDGGF